MRIEIITGEKQYSLWYQHKIVKYLTNLANKIHTDICTQWSPQNLCPVSGQLSVRSTNPKQMGNKSVTALTFAALVMRITDCMPHSYGIFGGGGGGCTRPNLLNETKAEFKSIAKAEGRGRPCIDVGVRYSAIYSCS
jgi:hypothetical protein